MKWFFEIENFEFELRLLQLKYSEGKILFRAEWVIWGHFGKSGLWVAQQSKSLFQIAFQRTPLSGIPWVSRACEVIWGHGQKIFWNENYLNGNKYEFLYIYHDIMNFDYNLVRLLVLETNELLAVFWFPPFYCVNNESKSSWGQTRSNRDQRNKSRWWNPLVPGLIAIKSQSSLFQAELISTYFPKITKIIGNILKNILKIFSVTLESKRANTIPVMKWLIFLFLEPNSFLIL